MKRLIAIVLIISTVFFFEISKNDDTYAMKKDISNKLIRFHVIANSDSKEDQSLKLKVRDAVIRSMNDKFIGVTNLKESEKIIKKNIPYIQKIAQDTIYANGKDYGVKVMYGRFDFPTKYYGTIMLPAGNYNALKIVIGKGEGKNWWCVMFPPLCFIDITYGLTSDETKKELSRFLSEDELSMIETEKPQVKFKVVEVLERYFNEIRMALKD
ncbi:MAG: stage II sporulation protein R [Thermoanaerobacterium sp.]|nr:stage II sporulation protein R [Thermoanaerobacterium sp.]